MCDRQGGLHASMNESVDDRTTSLGLLDGGQATHLESLGFDLSSALWSAALLRSEDANTNDAIVRVHKDYLTSGAQIIGTLTYQLSNKACAKAGWSKDEISQVAPLFEKAIHLAHEANARSQQQGGPRGLVSLTLGPYGAALANGSEYTGNYAEKGVEDSGSTQQPSFEDLTNFHFQRLTQAFDTAMSAKIDLIAFETIPRLDEAQAIVAALDRLAGCSDVTEGKLPPAYISFVFPPDAGGFLPFPPAEPEEHRKGPKEVVQFMCQAQAESKWPVTGVGINCTKPQLLRHAAEQMSGCMSQSSDWQALTLFLYPDGGLVWDGENRRWLLPDGSTLANSRDQPQDLAAEWARELWSVAAASAEAGCWNKVWLGGCCKTGPKEIEELRKLSAYSANGKVQ